MPHRQTPWVRQGRLRTAEKGLIQMDTPEWFDWLTHAKSFCYTGSNPLLRLSVRREKRRHTFYWYGYCKWGRKLHNIYLGKSQQLTQQHLEQACQTIWQRIRQQRQRQPVP